MYIACKIHNNSLGKTVKVNSEAEGINLLKEWAEAQFGRELTNDELNGLENNLELYNDEDSDNLYTFSLGVVEF